MIEKIATDISNKLNNSTPSRDFDDLVGMRTHLEEMKGLLRLDLDEEVRMIGIWGPPGIGKTTIARVLLNQFSSRFQLGAIMVDIRGYYKSLCRDEYNAKLQLQSEMLSLIINQKGIKIPHLRVAQERLKDKKVLLVLDEVDLLEQLDALAKEIQWFGPGSRIIITTEDLRVLHAHGIHHIYKVKFPSSDEALQIFCMHAFGQKHPDDGFFELAWEVTYLAGELPLGLKVLGSALRGMSKQEWKMILPRLKSRLDGKIGSIIKFSYDALDDEDKYLFLYIACLFNYQSAHKVKGVLASKFSHVGHGLRVLAERSLISIQNGYIDMHTLLEQFGKETSRKQFVHHGLTESQLLVGKRDTCELLNDDSTDSKRFIGINLCFPETETEEELSISEKALERMHDFQFVRINNYLAQLERLPSVIYHSQKIRSLDWNGFHNICLPSTFNTEFLVELNMQDSKLEKLWEGTKPLRNLKWMDLSNSTDLKELPDLSTATNLEELILRNCSSLVELPSSIGNAINLQELNLSRCTSLVKLPSSIENATNLQILDLSYCFDLVELPSSINASNLRKLDLNKCLRVVEFPAFENATNLQILNLSYCSNFVELPYTGNATKLEELKLDNCRSLVKLPSSIESATNLQILNLSDCSDLVELPSIGNATKLEKLNLKNCSSLVKLPFSINALNLKELNLQNCSRVVKLPAIENATHLLKLDLQNCSSLQELPDSIGNAINLQRLNLRNCLSLVELPSSIGYAINLQELNLSGCTSLVKIPSSMENATNLEELDFSGCSNLVELSSSIAAINLQELNLSGCTSLVKLPSSIENATNLKIVDLSGCSNLVELPSIGNASKLKELNLYNCSRLLELPALENATNLQKLDISRCSSVVKLPSSIGDLTNLREFDLSKCSSLVELPSSIINLQQLCELRMNGCSKLEALPTNINLESLETLDLTNCSQLKSFPEISTNIEDLNLTGTAIKEIPLSIRSWSRLSDFQISYFESLEEFTHALDIITVLHFVNEDMKEIPWLKGMSRLRELKLCNCNNLVSLPQLSDSLHLLHELRLYNCNNLVSLPQLPDSLYSLVAENCQSLERLDCSFNNPTTFLEFVLKFVNCPKLNQEARDLIMHTSTRRFAMLPGTEVPACFKHRATGGGSLTIKLNESPLPTSLRFKACIMLVKDEEESGDDRSWTDVIIKIMDKQKDLKVRCTPSRHYIYPLLIEHIYTFEVEAEQVTSTELVFEFKTEYSKWKIKECGLLQVLEVPS